ncbi:macro domain-containing protein [Nocardia farcinica]|uniref:macro domain-containing protein n=1 Tax=Nocardia farcinica TaxID=37329 RepID=UPI001893FCD3|nr:macro domain-containing protein [Nocardia farcinica]MBF6422894.1 macro domain-containing protein [Nocardia farcinica]MBF6434508.1 macro domain-containing protein [Nocardia farcinica]MBF6505593.1 macro domain-containing protein [Nocardia farcinica]
MASAIVYLTGDATAPTAPGPKIIAHIVNDAGRWGRGFVTAISRRWPVPEQRYRQWHRDRADNDFALGAVQLIAVDDELHVANMVGQHGIRTARTATAPIRYDALDHCLIHLATAATDLGATVHMPRIGTGLAGGTWNRVEPLLVDRLIGHGVAVTIYDLP